MSILNLGLQCVGLARTEMGKVFEQEVRKCNSLADLRQHIASYEDELKDLLSPVIAHLHSLFCRFKLHDKSVQSHFSTNDDELTIKVSCKIIIIRAGATGMAGTVWAVSLFKEKN